MIRPRAATENDTGVSSVPASTPGTVPGGTSEPRSVTVTVVTSIPEIDSVVTVIPSPESPASPRAALTVESVSLAVASSFATR
jgi:hypothetical protein